MTGPKKLFSLYPYMPCDLVWVRDLRDECAEFMTRYRETVTNEQQAEFEEALRYQSGSTLLYVLTSNTTGIVGFLVCRRDEADRWWVTYGISGAFRGRGLGRLLVAYSQTLFDEIHLEVRTDNHPAISLYNSMGFSSYGQADTGLLMRWQR